jgi:putative membrane protein
MESVAWRRPVVWRRFGLASQADADTTAPLAYNQGFYNLFLAVGAAGGVALAVLGGAGSGQVVAGNAVMLFACGSMVAAGIVLVTHNPRFASAAAVQVAPPLAAIVAKVLLG